LSVGTSIPAPTGSVTSGASRPTGNFPPHRPRRCIRPSVPRPDAVRTGGKREYPPIGSASHPSWPPGGNVLGR
jgi:hypothetical protein